MNRIETSWIGKEWVVVADCDAARFAAFSSTLVATGFPVELIVHAESSAQAIDLLADKKSAILFIDSSLGAPAFRHIHAAMKTSYGDMGFFLFAITEGHGSDFVHVAAEAHVDGIIFRPFVDSEFRTRVAEAFAVKWPNRVVRAGGGDDERSTFDRAMEKEKRLGTRDLLTPDAQVASIFGLKKVKHPAIKPGKEAFTQVQLSFKAVARNGDLLKKPYSILVLEIDENKATFESPAEAWEAGDHVTIEADIMNGDEHYHMRIEALVQGESVPGMMVVLFDKGNRTRFEAALKMVAKRFRELKDFFKYAKGA